MKILSEAGAIRRDLFHRRQPSRIRQLARDALPGIVVAVILALVYALFQTVQENRELRRVAAVKAAKVCPDKLGSMIFTHSGFQKADLGTGGRLARLSCYYSRGVKG